MLFKRWGNYVVIECSLFENNLSMCIFSRIKCRKHLKNQLVFFLSFCTQKQAFHQYFNAYKLKNLVWYSHNFLLPCIAVEEFFINSSIFMFNLCFLCFVVGELPAFIIIGYNFWTKFPYFAIVWRYSSNFYQ